MRNIIIEDIEYKMKYIEEITLKLGDKLNKEDYIIEDMGCPHNQPSSLKKGYSAIYMFILKNGSEYEFLKIGKANSKSSARFCSQHYSFSSHSTLAKSICNDTEFINQGINKENVKEWIKNNLQRVNIYIKNNKAQTELIEAIFHYAYRPRYEESI